MSPLRRPQGAIPATLWRGSPWRFVRALGWLTLEVDRIEWQPLVVTPFTRLVSIPVADFKRVTVGGVFIGPDLRIETDEDTFRFTVWRHEALRRWLAERGVPVDDR